MSKSVKYIVILLSLVGIAFAIGGYMYLQENGYFTDGKDSVAIEEDTTPLTEEEKSSALDSLQSSVQKISVTQANKILSQMGKEQFKPSAKYIQEVFDSLK
ncbi:MAG: hypothetical protein KBB54_02095 [Candidatus Pacebacteria bacterium]|nr:hypothetical protein [Candidatus Paceibacterota bacterium]MBP9818462.1 hypothetical protein [Candidatus Paceibacterota bacterium]